MKYYDNVSVSAERNESYVKRIMAKWMYLLWKMQKYMLLGMIRMEFNKC